MSRGWLSCCLFGNDSFFLIYLYPLLMTQSAAWFFPSLGKNYLSTFGIFYTLYKACRPEVNTFFHG
jgi:hypothetical protein